MWSPHSLLKLSPLLIMILRTSLISFFVVVYLEDGIEKNICFLVVNGTEDLPIYMKAIKTTNKES